LDDKTKNYPPLEDLMQRFWSSSALYGGNAAFIEELYAKFLENPKNVDPQWRDYFTRLAKEARQAGGNGAHEIDHLPVQKRFRLLARTRPGNGAAAAALRRGDIAAHDQKQVHVLQLINAYRFSGHLVADIDPLKLDPKAHVPELTLEHYGLGDQDLDTRFNTGSLVGPATATLRDILHHLQQTYCGTIGAEYMHISETSKKRWIQQRLEGSRMEPELGDEQRRRILDRLVAAEGLEKYLHTRYVGQKRFSLEGGLALIPMLDLLVQRSGEAGARELVIGMAHRGRLNVLTNILGKAPSELFAEFEGSVSFTNERLTGDVKYHQGFSSDLRTPGGPMHVALAFNPSHLEIVDPVVEGSVRARQERRGDVERHQVVPVLIHGDAAFAGQGVVMETFNMSETRGYGTGGTIHIIVNNQIGFTTSHPLDARSTYYCTEVARMVQAPIFHVNGDDPEAVAFITQLAVDYRSTYGKDIVIDLVCYRRFGHSEADEPAVTQPMMYKKIRAHSRITTVYAQRLTEMGIIEEGALEHIEDEYRRALDEQRTVALNIDPDPPEDQDRIDWSRFVNFDIKETTDTRVPLEQIQRLNKRLLKLPEGFELHPGVKRILEDRRRMGEGEMPLDWGFCESMAYATLLDDGYPVRISGQDSRRGTFFHRHAAVLNQATGKSIITLKRIGEGKANFEIINSLLSEEAVVAFEYGYATAEPNALVVWEAQFGDFANNAQVVIDQFIASGEAKWGRLCGLVLLLPHGYDGQGPEHSSARLERYLQLCAQDNMRVVQPSTPAQIFQLLRGQVIGRVRKPLVVMSPKSLLRHDKSVSRLEDLTTGSFQPVISEVADVEPERIKRVILCSGKTYYNLLEERNRRIKDRHTDTAIIRLEQLYPFPENQLRNVLQSYPSAGKIVWAQDEPENQGPWFYIWPKMHAIMSRGQSLKLSSRPASASPAAGYFKLHQKQERDLVQHAFEI
jgi:2-oxoglutarate dehydrogenase E1 component